MVVLYDGEGNFFVGLLKAAVKTARGWGMGHSYLGMIQRQDPKMDRPETMITALLCVGVRSQSPRPMIFWYSESVTVENVEYLTARVYTVSAQKKQKFH